MQRFFRNFPYSSYLILYSFDLPTKYNHDRVAKIQKSNVPIIESFFAEKEKTITFLLKDRRISYEKVHNIFI